MLFLLVAATVTLFLAGLSLAFSGSSAGAGVARVERALAARGEAAPEAESILRETQSDLGSLVSKAAGRFPPLRALELTLYQAGSPMSLGRLLLACVGLALAGAAAGSLLGLTAAPALLGGLPVLVVRMLKKRRMAAFDRQFPQALALFARALRAGHSMSAALQMVGDELPDPVGPEFALVSREISLGLSAPVAMANLQDRLDTSDLPVFVTAVLVQLETGGNLAEILDNLASVIRERQLFDGKVRALTAQSRMSANILVVVPFAIGGLVTFMQPDFMAPMIETPAGRLLAYVGTGMVAVGYVLCRKIARVAA
jgi:tight adherence protein B